MSKRGSDPNAVYRSARQHFEKHRYGEARRLLLGLVPAFPREANLLRMLGASCCETGHFDEGVGYLLRVCEIEPSPLDHFNLGKALQLAGRYESALKAHETGLKLAPLDPQLMQARALTLHQLGRRDEAIAAFEQALARTPDFPEALTNYADALLGARRFTDAAAQIAKAVSLEPGNLPLLSSLVRTRMHVCDWTDFGPNVDRLIRAAAVAADPFAMLTISDTPETQLAAVRGGVARLPSARPRGTPGAVPRIRVGYVSADIRAHAISYLIAGLIEAHDRNRFEIVVISNGPPDDSPGRNRITAAADRFEDLFGKPPSEQLAAMDALDLHIAVDLMGHTTGNSPAAFASRIAPVQVNFLGYPGTTAIDAMDYIILDPFIATERITRNLTERAAVLPHCYQPNDPLRPRPGAGLSRAEYGLPEAGTVFCSFNNTGKITPDAFARWMRILSAVDGSVLWLFARDAAACENLRNEARRLGIVPERLVFAGYAPHEAHLARFLAADIFLDTFPYGAHTTASDALWMACPVVTLVGDSFPSRVAGSLLTTIGMPELITTTPEAYETLAIALAHDPDRRTRLRVRLDQMRATTPLFSAARFARDLERAYATMWERAIRGSRPKAFKLDPEA